MICRMNSCSKLFSAIFAVSIVSGILNPAFSGGKAEHKSKRVVVVEKKPSVIIKKYYYSPRHGGYISFGMHGSVFFPIPFGRVVVSLPGVYRVVYVGSHAYYYCDGIFYERHPHGYVVVRPPRVRFIPYDARRIVIGGEVYFLHNDLYYCYRDGFYEVCEPPAVVEKKDEAKTVIMVENSNGSRTPVELEPLGNNQWRGPRGEIYDGLPSEEQLRKGYGF